LDDVIDTQDSLHKADWTLCSQILFNQFMSVWWPIFEEHPPLWSHFTRYHTQGMAAALEEVHQVQNALVAEAGTESESLLSIHVTMGRKAALAKFYAATLKIRIRSLSLN